MKKNLLLKKECTMKITKKDLLNPKCNLYSSLARCAALFSAITFGYASYGQEVSQIYFKTPTSTETSHLNRVTNWCTDADKTIPFEGSFTDMGVQYDANVTTHGTVETMVTKNLESILNWRNLNQSLLDFNNEWRGNFLTMGGSKSLNIAGDWNLHIKAVSNAKNVQKTAQIILWENSEINVGGDWNISTDKNGTGAWFGVRIQDGDGERSGKVHIRGNVVFANSGNITGAILSNDNLNFTVDGVIDLNGTGSWAVFDKEQVAAPSVMRTIGGLGDADGNGISKGNLYITSRSPAEATILFTNSKSYEFEGTYRSDPNYEAKLNLTMMANDAKNGRQILRFTKGGTGWPNGYTVTDNNINNVEISKGRMDIGMEEGEEGEEGLKGNDLYLASYSGNSADAVFSATGTSLGSEVGKVVFDTMSFYKGTIVFDILELENDFIKINNGVTCTPGSSELVFDINITKSDLEIYLGVLGVEILERDLMEFKTSDSNIVADDIIVKTQDGIDGKISFIENLESGLTTIQIGLTVVPEPATWAAIFGALALLVAVAKRRRR